ncbi:DUF357 domain-containing protein [Candidatus Micrarchaeota archaeon]|nr:DUF357 domain-containing protein [Candidatus Micrarchaeota archaeon]
MDEERRIRDDIEQFYKSVKDVREAPEIVELATRYCKDAQFYLDKKDYVTAFGCINYAHGLIDAVKKLEESGWTGNSSCRLR